MFQNRFLNYGLVLAAGLFLGWLLFHPKQAAQPATHEHEAVTDSVWTCSMHPQIRSPKPGKCPLCGMDLIPLSQGSAGTTDPEAIVLTPEAAQLANVLTTVVTKQTPAGEIRLYGKVDADERLLQRQVAHIAGRIESLNVNFTGEHITVGQTLGKIYSPELVTAQQELLEAARMKVDQPEIYEAAKEKLRLWKFSEDQISEMERSGTISTTVNIVSNTGGVILSLKVSRGDYVSPGTVLFETADLSKVWILFDAYENDLQFLKIGDKIIFTVQAIPGMNYSGKIAFIDPVIDQVTRIARVRVETGNSNGSLKPGMFATGVVSIIPDSYRNKIVIPGSSVLWTGRRSVVYVKQSSSVDPSFKMRVIELGPRLGDSYVVEDGLDEGEEIVTNGTFSVDAAAQLEGKPSMLNRGEEF